MVEVEDSPHEVERKIVEGPAKEQPHSAGREHLYFDWLGEEGGEWRRGEKGESKREREVCAYAGREERREKKREREREGEKKIRVCAEREEGRGEEKSEGGWGGRQV